MKDRAEYQKEYYKKNRDKLVVKRRENYKKNKAHYKEYQAEYRSTWNSKKKYLGAFIDKELAEEFLDKLKENELSYTDFLVLSIRKYLRK